MAAWAALEAVLGASLPIRVGEFLHHFPQEEASAAFRTDRTDESTASLALLPARLSAWMAAVRLHHDAPAVAVPLVPPSAGAAGAEDRHPPQTAA